MSLEENQKIIIRMKIKIFNNKIPGINNKTYHRILINKIKFFLVNSISKFLLWYYLI